MYRSGPEKKCLRCMSYMVPPNNLEKYQKRRLQQHAQILSGRVMFCAVLEYKPIAYCNTAFPLDWLLYAENKHA